MAGPLDHRRYRVLSWQLILFALLFVFVFVDVLIRLRLFGVVLVCVDTHTFYVVELFDIHFSNDRAHMSMHTVIIHTFQDACFKSFVCLHMFHAT